MTTGLLTVIIGMLLIIVALLAGMVIVILRRRAASGSISVQTGIQHMRAIGQLSVFKVITKEIVTETDHSWGDFGTKYLSWVISEKKMAMIFEFEISFYYDLRRPDFEIEAIANNAYRIKMPPCFLEAHIRDIKFYDEQKSRLLPWLVPDLLNGFLPIGFSQTDKNKLVAAAKSHAENQAVALITNLQREVQNSAQTTLQSISRAFGVREVVFEFLPQGKISLDVGVGRDVAA